MPLIEVEPKRELKSHEPVEQRLEQSGFVATEPTIEIDTYYSRPDVDFLVTVECLRVRERDGGCEVTYKPASDPITHSTAGVIAKQETNVALADPAQAAHAHALLEVLGMVRLARVEKSRTCYRAPGRGELSVVVDTVAGLGTFIETEVVSEDSRQGAVRRLEETERLLGLDSLLVVTSPYRDLLLSARATEEAVRTPML